MRTRFVIWVRAFSPTTKKIVSVLVALIVGMGIGLSFLFFFLPSLTAYFADELSTSEIIAFTAVMLSIAALTISFVREALRHEYNAKHRIRVSVKVEHKIVTLTCFFENMSKIRVYPQHFYVFIEAAPLLSEYGVYKFPNVLEHKDCERDCSLGTICKNNSALKEYPQQVLSKDNHGIHLVHRLQHIAPESITYIDPGENFSEDVNLILDDGVYRAILVATSKNKDCVCTQAQFVIQTSPIGLASSDVDTEEL